MKKLLLLMLTLVLMFSSMAMAQTDEEWRTERSAAQGHCVEGLSQEEFDALAETTIIKDAASITGYTVTFRYYAPDAERVRIRGEWNLTSAHDYTLADKTYYAPEEWTAEKFAITPWRGYEMEKNEETGVWSYTIPLASGTWSYRFIVNGVEGADVSDFTDAQNVLDPNNLPFAAEEGGQNNSQIRVPFDAEKQTADNSLQLPRQDGKVGVSETVQYQAQAIAAMEGGAENPGLSGTGALEEGVYTLCVYTPYGYDFEREEPYKVLYISHGGGVEGATSWYNKGSVANLVDNLIAEGIVEPFVMVIIDNFATNFNVENLLTNIAPFIEKHYNVCAERSGRAIAGLSQGSGFTTNQMIVHPDFAKYYALFSNTNQWNADNLDLDMDALADAHLFMSFGMQELMDNPQKAVALLHSLTEEGIFFDFRVCDGGHHWSVWRQNFTDFCAMTLWK